METEKKIDPAEVLASAADTIVQKPVEVTVTIEGKTRFQRWLQKVGIVPRQKVFSIEPLYLGSMVRISKLLLGMDFSAPEIKAQLQAKKFLQLSYQLISSHGEDMAEIVAIAIQNNRERPSRKLIRFILRNFTSDEIRSVLTVVIHQMNLTGFLSSIIAALGLNVLEMQDATASDAESPAVSL